MPHVTKAEFARIMGVKRVTVTRACQRGRLSRALVKDATGHEVLDLEIAKQEWEDNCKEHNRSEALQAREASRKAVAVPTIDTPPEPEEDEEEPSPVGPDGKPMSSAERKRHWDAVAAEIKARKAAGELCEIAVFEKKVADLAARFKTKLLGVPSRAKQADPDLTIEQITLVENLIRECLESDD